MKFWKPILSVVWIAVLVLVLVFYVFPKDEAEHNSVIQELEKANEELIIKNLWLDRDISQLKKQADSLNRKILNSDLTIQKLQDELDEKINTINNMSDVELYGYFTRFRTYSTAD